MKNVKVNTLFQDKLFKFFYALTTKLWKSDICMQIPLRCCVINLKSSPTEVTIEETTSIARKQFKSMVIHDQLKMNYFCTRRMYYSFSDLLTKIEVDCEHYIDILAQIG